jgi:hypothetical protein
VNVKAAVIKKKPQTIARTINDTVGEYNGFEW